MTVGLVRSVKVVVVPGGVRAPLSAEGGAGSDVPSALSTPPFSCRKRFLLNLARAFWNQTCKPIPIDFFIDFFLSSFLSLPFFSLSFFPFLSSISPIKYHFSWKVDFFYFFQNKLIWVIELFSLNRTYSCIKCATWDNWSRETMETKTWRLGGEYTTPQKNREKQGH